MAKELRARAKNPDDKKRLDKEFLDKTRALATRLDQEKGLSKWTYIVNSWLIDPLIRDRSQLMVDKKDDKKSATSSEATPTDSNAAPPDFTEPLKP